MNRSQKDNHWLGEDAYLAPAARAALGILLQARDWSWWEQPNRISESLERVLPRYLPAKWGGDSNVWNADEWLDPMRAVMLAEAFNKHIRLHSLKIKVVRSVWTWKESDDLAGSALREITGELAGLIGSGNVFPEWERNSRPRLPNFTGPHEQKCLLTSPDRDLFADGWVTDYLTPIEWDPDSRVADIAVTHTLESLHRMYAARLVVIYGQAFNSSLAHVNVLREALRAQCAIHVHANASDTKLWLSKLVNRWSTGESFSEALNSANALSGIHAQVLASTQTFMINSHSFPGLSASKKLKDSSDEYEYISSVKSSLRSYIADKDESHASPPVLPMTSPPVERLVDAWLLHNGERLDRWSPKGETKIAVQIKIRTPLRDNQPLFPDEKIAWSGDSKTLQIHLFELGYDPQTVELQLPRNGNSPIVYFNRRHITESIDLRLIIADGAQILQTARINSTRNMPIKFSIENIVSPVQGNEKNFDVALLVNDSLGNQPSLTVITQAGEAIFQPLPDHETAEARTALLHALQEAVSDPDVELRPLLIKLANLGALFQRHIRSVAPNWPGCEGRLQLLTQSDAFFPIEYLYDGTSVESPDAPLCPERATCLNNGYAKPGCELRTSGDVLCPMGFLGVSGVIERHSWKVGLAPRQWNTPARERIDDLSKIAFTASDRADRFTADDVYPHEVVKISMIESALGVNRVSDWRSWKERIRNETPSLLLMVVHLEDSMIHTGNDHKLMLAGLSELHVGSAPVAIAIGCSTGQGEIPGGSLPAILQRSGVRVVVAAMTSILGRHANRMARDLAHHLREAAQTAGSKYVGDIVSQLRRNLLANDLALGLAVIAFGDAEIVLGKN